MSGAGTTPCNVAAAGNCLAYWDRAFIQFAGFTVGRAQSFFDMYTFGGAYTYLNTRTSGDTGAAGEDLWAYTVQFGNGVSYTLSLEDPAAHNKYGTCDGSAGLLGDQRRLDHQHGFTIQGAANNGFRVPDVVTNLRIDQAWGYLGVSTAIHDVSGGYYTTPRSGRQRPSVDHLRLGGIGLWLLQPPGRRLVRLQLRVGEGRSWLCLQLRQLADLQQQPERRRGLGRRRPLRLRPGRRTRSS